MSEARRDDPPGPRRDGPPRAGWGHYALAGVTAEVLAVGLFLLALFGVCVLAALR
ncbi:MAG TPA: hypothetical protein VGL40_00760 [Bacillota bacterium]|jgi:hypothetical protein